MLIYKSLPPVLADTVPFGDEDEGEAFDFDDSGDEIPDAPPAPLALISKDQSQDNCVTSPPMLDPPAPSPTSNAAPSSADIIVVTSRSSSADGTTVAVEETSAAEGSNDREKDLPPPPSPPPPLDDHTQTDPGTTGLQTQLLT